MSYYINCIKSDTEISRDIKELIPDMNSRRRMSNIVKTAVSTGMDVIADFGNTPQIDAIITASRLGCIADSEKFLTNIIDNKEQMLNPTPFIQSTFNTVGAQIALLKKIHCYNMTYSHREISLESAILDAMIRIDSGISKAVLIGVFDEITPTVSKILARMKVKEHESGALFFVLSAQKQDSSTAQLLSLSFEHEDTYNAITINGNMASAIKSVINNKSNGETTIINTTYKKVNSLIKLKCI